MWKIVAFMGKTKAAELAAFVSVSENHSFYCFTNLPTAVSQLLLQISFTI